MVRKWGVFQVESLQVGFQVSGGLHLLSIGLEAESGAAPDTADCRQCLELGFLADFGRQVKLAHLYRRPVGSL